MHLGEVLQKLGLFKIDDLMIWQGLFDLCELLIQERLLWALHIYKSNDYLIAEEVLEVLYHTDESLKICDIVGLYNLFALYKFGKFINDRLPHEG